VWCVRVPVRFCELFFILYFPNIIFELLYFDWEKYRVCVSVRVRACVCLCACDGMRVPSCVSLSVIFLFILRFPKVIFKLLCFY
jgi:hypothetical protein